MQIKFFERGSVIILRGESENSSFEQILTQKQFHDLIARGADILEHRIKYNVYEVENIKSKIPTTKGN